MSVSLVLLICAFVSFLLSLAGVGGKISFTTLGLALWVLAQILGVWGSR